MNEAQTRLNKIDPKLRDAGWGIVPGSNILVEQSAYIAPGRITTTGHKNPRRQTISSNPRLTAFKRTATRFLRSATP